MTRVAGVAAAMRWLLQVLCPSEGRFQGRFAWLVWFRGWLLPRLVRDRRCLVLRLGVRRGGARGLGQVDGLRRYPLQLGVHGDNLWS